MSLRQWSRDLGLGTRFAFTGGREGWVRVLLTAVGVGLGVALLLLTTAIPNAMAVRHQRDEARLDYTYDQTHRPKAADTLLISDVDDSYHGSDIRGRLVEPEGPRAPVAPGLSAYPAPGDMVVSPALKRLLDSDDGRLLRERLPYRIAGTIGERGLIGSHELAYYAGAKDLASRLNGWQTARIKAFGRPQASTSNRLDPVLLLLVLVVFVVLLMPVAVFIAAAVRFGGERRDRRLAALRLVGSDSRMTRRIAAGEALAGSLVGLVLGAVFFLLGRQLAGSVDILGISVFPSYLNPSPALAVLVALAVPTAAVLVTLFALRGVVIEPLGVVRTAKPARRRLWWRLLLPLGGLAMLAPMIGQGRSNGDFNQYLVIGGVLLLLVGVTTLLPWVVEAAVARLNSGGLAWQLAVRRLQLSSGSAARMVNGIAVAVAGAIALQMLFAGVQGDYTKATGQDVDETQMQVQMPRGDAFVAAAAKFAATKGVREVTALGGLQVGDGSFNTESGPGTQTGVTVGDCAALRKVAALPSCRDGDVFVARGGDKSMDTDTARLARPGRELHFDTGTGFSAGRDFRWRLPNRMKQVRAIKDPNGNTGPGLLMTPAAVPHRMHPLISGQVYLSLDESVPDVHEYVRNTAARIDPMADTVVWAPTERSKKFTSIRTGLLVGATCVLALIGVSLLVSQLEQLRERKKLLSALVAFGTRRRTLSLSVLWQTAIPIALGLTLALTVGLTLGAVLLKMVGATVSVDWPSVLTMTGIGAAVVLAVTLLSLPPLLRMMRPEGLRTE
ncbi:ABC transporter permease [Streptomyces sp. SID486]|uniref:ABC transporter permease n=1 Tax=unclassified Streptomyces TaxID=2593676 RepID=UPI001369226E|nr:MULTISPECIES: FtsX-like permease family protein [unclassified Streptomyces]MYW46518.1 ABC transporter permease [Streptomyces sp. SID161]MYX97380.1 ABC transporter permease [Streptomyces sp. SID486]